MPPAAMMTLAATTGEPALGDEGIPGGPGVYSTRCPPLPRLRMRESRDIVHRATLRAKGIDPDLVPSPAPASASSSDAHHHHNANARHRGGAISKSGKVASPVHRPLPPPAFDDGEIESLLLESSARRGVGGGAWRVGGGGGDFTRGVGADNHLRVAHEVAATRLARRRDANAVEESQRDLDRAKTTMRMTNASDNRSRRAAAKNPKGGQPHACAEANAASASEPPPSSLPLATPLYVPLDDAPGPTKKKFGAAKKNKNTAADAAPRRRAEEKGTNGAPSPPNGGGNASGNARIHRQDDTSPPPPPQPPSGKKMKAALASSAPSAPSASLAPPSGSGSKKVLGSASASAPPRRPRPHPQHTHPAHISAAVDDRAASLARAERRAIAAASATARKAEAERNAAEARRARLESELASLEADLDAHRRGRGDAIQRERSEASRVAALERELEGRLASVAEAHERLRERSAIEARLARVVDALRAGAEALQATLRDCDHDVAACGAYAAEACEANRRASDALEWIRAKYLARANAWKRNVDAAKAEREALIEDLKLERAEDRRAKKSRELLASRRIREESTTRAITNEMKALVEVRETEEGAARAALARLAGAVRLKDPSARRPEEIVDATRESRERRESVQRQIERARARESRARATLERLEKRRRLARLGLDEEEDEEGLLPDERLEENEVPDGADASEKEDAPANDDDAGRAENDDAGRAARPSKRRLEGPPEPPPEESASPAPPPRASFARVSSRRRVVETESRVRLAERRLSASRRRFASVALVLVTVEEGLRKIDKAVTVATAAREGDEETMPTREDENAEEEEEEEGEGEEEEDGGFGGFGHGTRGAAAVPTSAQVERLAALGASFDARRRTMVARGMDQAKERIRNERSWGG